MCLPCSVFVLAAGLCLLSIHLADAKAKKGGKAKSWWEVQINEALARKSGIDQNIFDWGGKPDHEKIMLALKAAHEPARTALMEKIVNAYWTWPGTWNNIFYDLLEPGQPWTEDYCRKFIRNKSWSPNDAIFANYAPALAPLRYMKEQAELIKRFEAWMATADNGAGTDAKLEELVKGVRKSSKEKMISNGPFVRLAEYQHAKILTHLLNETCKDTSNVAAFLDRRDEDGQTLLHIAAKNGKTELAKAIMNLKSPKDRAAYAAMKDKEGHRAEDLARFAYLEHTADALVELSGQGSKSTHARTLKDMFKPAENAAQEKACSPGEPGSSCSANKSGGWDTRVRDDLVPKEWLLDDCFADSIDASQFDWEVFNNMYVRHKRPLLIRNVQPADPEFYTKKGLLKQAGDFRVKVQPIPYKTDKVKFKKLSKFIKQLSKRTNPAKDLDYLFVGPVEDEELRPVMKVPDLLEDTPWGNHPNQITQFFVGGVLMGSQPHYHHSAVNLLAHGTKLWMMRPWTEPLWGQIPAYEYLRSEKGVAGSMKCMQRSGDLLFVPSQWVHTVICLSDCIGSAYEYADETNTPAGQTDLGLGEGAGSHEDIQNIFSGLADLKSGLADKMKSIESGLELKGGAGDHENVPNIFSGLQQNIFSEQHNIESELTDRLKGAFDRLNLDEL